jgi:hypothetical protein
MAKFGFDTAEIEVNAPEDYSPIPEGEYSLQALEAEEKETNNKKGTLIKAKFEVMKGPHTGRWIWENFNINNPSEVAQRIGRSQLVAWATACGKPDADDTDKLIGKTFQAVVKVTPAENGYAESNAIKSFLFEKKAEQPVVSSPASTEKEEKSNPWD